MKPIMYFSHRFIDPIHAGTKIFTCRCKCDAEWTTGATIECRTPSDIPFADICLQEIGRTRLFYRMKQKYIQSGFISFEDFQTYWTHNVDVGFRDRLVYGIQFKLAGIIDDNREMNYKVTCPKCNTETVARWVILANMGGIEPTDCPKCGYTMMCESGEGNPIEIKLAENLRDKERSQ